LPQHGETIGPRKGGRPNRPEIAYGANAERSSSSHGKSAALVAPWQTKPQSRVLPLAEPAPPSSIEMTGDTADEYRLVGELRRPLWRTVAVCHPIASRFERGPSRGHFAYTLTDDDAIKRVGLEELVRNVYQARHHAPSNECTRFDNRARTSPPDPSARSLAMNTRFAAVCVLTPLLASVSGLHCTRVAARPEARALGTNAESPAAVTTSPKEPGAHPAAPPPAPLPDYFAELEKQARDLAAEPATERANIDLPRPMAKLTYDQWRKIRFRPEKGLWRNEPGRFEVQFFHPGFTFLQGVTVSLIENGQAHRFPFSTDLFSYEGLPAPPPPAGLEFTGFRVHTPLNVEEYRDEVVVFNGASYFRPLGKGNVYGLSARGLAIDMGEPKPEEFPVFTRFYLVRPGASDRWLWILALLESRRATGAYAFHVQPGDPTLIDVTARIFVREPVAALGIAPLTSMYLFGEDAPNRFGDFRPEVHDSDGLSLWGSTGEWLFRPLRNPQRTVTSSFRLDAPRGFGLVQRDRTFDHFQDLEARYQDRPSAWVEPLAGFEKGSLRLLEIATELETDDNIAMAWVPDVQPDRGQPLSIAYRLHVGSADDVKGPTARVEGTRIGKTEKGVRFLVDFVGPELLRGEEVQAVVSISGGSILEQHVERNSFAEGVRASFEVATEPNARDVELRAFLKSKDDVLTETWSYLWQPN
jgi:glucans biosynthesis protein